VAERIKATINRAISGLRRHSRAVWHRDRAALGGWAALWTRFARIATWSVRGVVTLGLSTQAAALAYYTMFSIVPILVVVLWALKLFHLIGYLTPPEAMPNPAEVQLPNANALLRQAVRGILVAVQNAGRLETGLAGLAALLYGVIRQVGHVERALDTIASAHDRPPRYRRMLGYLALLALPPALFIVSGLLRVVERLPGGVTVTRWISWLLAHAPMLKSALGVVIGLALLCLALAIFYSSAARARIVFRSALFGGALGALALAVVLWVFMRLQIGVSRAGALQSGLAAVPVFLLWAFSSWLVVLIGAQVAVAHELDGILVHGARALRLDPYGEQVAGLQIMLETTRRALFSADERAGGGAPDDARAATTNELARDLRLLPEEVRDVARRLETAGLLHEPTTGTYRLACDPDRTGLRDVVGAMIGGPEDARAAGASRRGPSLHELVLRGAGTDAK
jgi:membrane protein